MLDSIGSLLGNASPMNLLGGPDKAGPSGGIGGILGGILGGGGDGGGFFSDVLDIVTAGGPGSILNKALDTFGLPDVVGDIAGTVLDACTGNIPGAVSNGLDMLEDVAKDLGLEEVAPFLKMGSEIANVFSNPTAALQGAGIGGDALKFVDAANGLKEGGIGGAIGPLLGGAAGGGDTGEMIGVLGDLMGGGSVDSADINSLGAMLGMFGGGEMAAEAAGSVRI